MVNICRLEVHYTMMLRIGQMLEWVCVREIDREMDRKCKWKSPAMSNNSIVFGSHSLSDCRAFIRIYIFCCADFN